MSEKEANRDRVNPATLAARNECEHGPLIDQVLRDYPKLTREVAELTREVAERMLKEAGH